MGEHMLVENLLSTWWIVAAAFLAPMLALGTRRKIPDVVWLLLLGMLIGPFGLQLAEQTEAVEFLRELGMGFLFLLAGLEINTGQMRGRQGRSAALTWVICLVLGIGAGLLVAQGELHVAIVFAIASTSTALGTLLPILKDSGKAVTPLGSATMLHGALGELGPIVAMSLLLSTRGTLAAALVLVAFALAAVLVVLVPHRLFTRIPLLGRAMAAGANTTMQTTLRFTVLILITLMLLTAVLQLDVALGAFAAGMLLNAVLAGAAAEHGRALVHKVETIGFSFLIPIFFVTSGMSIDIGSVVSHWPVLLGFVLSIAVVRGLPVFLREQLTETHSELSTVRDRLALALYASTGLPIIVAVTQIAVSSELIEESMASVMVTGGAITVLLFPLLAQIVEKGRASAPSFDAA
ncbi:cation:proton antiporter [Nesterenkonia xinjiangensis]|uniref:Kef-type K+ transport system membrane component KefB n=1 Tax=Nesterenkonia xinjiangensis TaxID=225327 RepID=A0A7Z0K9A8_9MICC|nr:cation:proton antiporter [Nesterenkonia xinjiangensis]NYJ78501.1 Kef-type K+ transport system membrane component KefB [Nesterenkonia xinjiangensis]